MKKSNSLFSLCGSALLLASCNQYSDSLYLTSSRKDAIQNSPVPIESSPSPSPEPSVTPSPSPSPKPSATPSSTSSPRPSPTVAPSPTPSPSPTTGCVAAPAGTFYVDATLGADTNNGTNTCTPWKTITKVNAMTFAPGNFVLFKRGETFYGTLLPKSGGSGSPVTYGAYGSGAKPVITGLTNVTAWTNLGGNLWESTNPIPITSASRVTSPNVVVLGGASRPKGRFPNSGYLTYTSHSGNSSITGSLTGSPNWTGAELVIRKHHYMVDIADISSQSGGTLNYTSPGNSNEPTNGYGYYIQDDLRTLDTQNEWYYDPSRSKLTIYSASMPVNVQVATLDTLLYLRHSSRVLDNLRFENLTFRGSNRHLVDMQRTNGITIAGCDFIFGGQDGLNHIWGMNTLVQNSTFRFINQSGIKALSIEGDYSMIGNSITDVGLEPGMLGRGVGTDSVMRGIAIHSVFEYAKILAQGNTIDRVGYHGIEFMAPNILIKNNIVRRFCSVIDDGGGIYTYAGSDVKVYNPAIRVIEGNLVLDGQAPMAGAPVNSKPGTTGIYMDGSSHDITIIGNTVANNIGGNGFFGNDIYRMRISGNTFFNNLYAQFAMADMGTTGVPSTDVDLTNNIFVAVDRSSMCLSPGDIASAPLNSIFTQHTNAGNVFARPLDDTKVFYWYNYAINPPFNLRQQTLAEWQASNPGLEGGSRTSPKTTTSADNIRFEYNPTASTVTIPLGGTYTKMDGTTASSITLAPYSSAVLIK